MHNISACYTNSKPNRIHECYEKLVTSVQTPETINILREINGYVRSTNTLKKDTLF